MLIISLKNLIISFAAAYCLPLVIPTSSENIYNHAISIAMFFLIFFFLQKQKKKISIYGYIGGAIFSFILIAGMQIIKTGIVPMKNVSFYMGMFAYTTIFAKIIEIMWAGIGQYTIKKRPNVISGSKGLKYWGIIFVSWLPVWLALYPGAFAYDAEVTFNQYINGNYTAHFPVLHTIFQGMIIEGIWKLTKNINLGIAVYCLIQMLIMSFIFSWCTNLMRSNGAPSGLIYGSLAWYAGFPVISITVGCSTRDVLFSAIILVDAVWAWKYLRREMDFKISLWEYAEFAVLNFLIIVLRTTGIYVFIGIAICLLILARKEIKRIFIKCFLCALGLYLIYIGPVYKALNVEPANSRVAFSVPLQQMSKVYRWGGEITDTEEATLFEILPQETIELYYTPHLADWLNGGFQIDTFKKNPLKYVKLWSSLGVKNSVLYLSAFLDHTLGYWYPGASIDGYTQLYRLGSSNAASSDRHPFMRYAIYKDSSYFAPIVEPPGVRDSKIPWLEKLILGLTLKETYRNIPIFSMLFSPGTLFCILLFVMLYSWKEKRWDDFCGESVIFITVMACFVGPIVLIRYCLILFYSLPILLFLLIGGGKYNE